MSRYSIAHRTEDGVRLNDRYNAQSAEAAVEKALGDEPLRSWLEDGTIDEESTISVTTRTTEHDVLVGDVLDEEQEA